MIRPITCICMMLAAGSGLYLYQVKHRTEMLDHSIEQTLKATEAVHEHTRLLSAEWALLNDPSRLSDMAGKFLTLHPVAPNQFVTMAELDKHLPPVQSYPAAGTTLSAPTRDMPPAEAPAPEPKVAVQQAPTSQVFASSSEPARAEKQAADKVAMAPKLASRSEAKSPERPAERQPEKHEALALAPPPPPRAPVGTVAGPMPTPVSNPMMLNPVLSRVMATNARTRTTHTEEYGSAATPPAAPPVNRATHYNSYPPSNEAPRMVSALGSSTHSLLAPPVPVGSTTQAALLEPR